MAVETDNPDRAETEWDQEKAREAHEERERVDAQNQVNFERQMALAERQIAAQERLAAIGDRPVYGDGPTERMTAFFDLSTDQKAFRLREAAIWIAATSKLAEKNPHQLVDIAADIFSYVKGDVF